MPTDVKLYSVIIASPGDITEEREIIREEIHQWNSMHAVTTQMILQPIGWETDSTPDLRDDGQSVINSQLVDSCDLLIGVFWTRIGTPTQRARSGTVEEVERFVSQGKRCIIYFSDKPTQRSKVDPKQEKQLQEYKAELKKRGLTDSFTTNEKFREKVSRHISMVTQQISREETERRATENEAKLTEQAIGLSAQPKKRYEQLETSFENITNAQYSVKSLIASPFGLQDLEDVRDREVGKIRSVLNSPELATYFSQSKTPHSISTTTKIIEDTTSTAMYAVSAIVRYADDSLIDWVGLIGDWIERLSVEKHESGYVWVNRMKVYPGLLVLYALGIASVRTSKLSFLKEVLELKTYSYEYNQDFYLVYQLSSAYIFNDAASMIEPGFENRYTPVSDHLDQIIKELIYPQEESNLYSNWFDFFEFLLALKAIQLGQPPNIGTYSWRTETERFIIASLQDAAGDQGRLGKAIIKFFDSLKSLEEAAKEYDKIVENYGRHRLFNPPKQISVLIDLAKSGVRVSSFREARQAASST